MKANSPFPITLETMAHGQASIGLCMTNARTTATEQNGYGPLKVNWTDDLGYWPSHKTLSDFGRCIMNNELPISDDELKTNLIKWNLVDSKGNPTIPVPDAVLLLHSSHGNAVDKILLQPRVNTQNRNR